MANDTTTHNLSLDSDKRGVTVILTVWKRDHLDEQLYALSRQTKQPYQVWVYKCSNHIDTDILQKKYSNVEWIVSSINLKYFGRFSLAQYVSSDYLYILDDDVIPSDDWLEKAVNLCSDKNAIIASAGRFILPAIINDIPSIDLKKYMIGNGGNDNETNFCHENTEVDFGCNSWVLKREWMSFFWKIYPLTLDNAEDIHLSLVLKELLHVSTIVPAQSKDGTCGNLKKYYGSDSIASWKKIGFISQRVSVVKYYLKNLGWRPIKWREDELSDLLLKSIG